MQTADWSELSLLFHGRIVTMKQFSSETSNEHIKLNVLYNPYYVLDYVVYTLTFTLHCQLNTEGKFPTLFWFSSRHGLHSFDHPTGTLSHVVKLYGGEVTCAYIFLDVRDKQILSKTQLQMSTSGSGSRDDRFRTSSQGGVHPGCISGQTSSSHVTVSLSRTVSASRLLP